MGLVDKQREHAEMPAGFGRLGGRLVLRGDGVHHRSLLPCETLHPGNPFGVLALVSRLQCRCQGVIRGVVVPCGKRLTIQYQELFTQGGRGTGLGHAHTPSRGLRLWALPGGEWSTPAATTRGLAILALRQLNRQSSCCGAGPARDRWQPGKAAHRICYPLAWSIMSVQARHALTACGSTRARRGWWTAHAPVDPPQSRASWSSTSIVSTARTPFSTARSLPNGVAANWPRCWPN